MNNVKHLTEGTPWKWIVRLSLLTLIGYYCNYLNHIFEDFGRKQGLNYTQLSVPYAIYRRPGCTQKTYLCTVFIT